MSDLLTEAAAIAAARFDAPFCTWCEEAVPPYEVFVVRPVGRPPYLVHSIYLCGAQVLYRGTAPLHGEESS